MNMNTKHAIELTDANFEELVLNNPLPTMIDFWAEWCGPCRVVGPIVDELANDYEGRVVVGKVNVDNNPQLAIKYDIRSIPTLLVIKGGEVVSRSLGSLPKTALEEKLKMAIDANESEGDNFNE